MPEIDEGGYLITPREFERKMEEIFNDSSMDKEEKHMAADELMVKTLNSLGFSTGTKIFIGMEKWYA